MTDRARYLYAIGRGIEGTSFNDQVGLEGNPLEVVSHRGLDAVVSHVDLAEFGEEGLRRNLEDLAWLERVARRHDDVVQAVARQGPTAPLRLATICLDDEGVRRRLDEWHDAISAALDRVQGRSEWGVKVLALSRPETEPAGEAHGEPGSGAAYLRRKKQESEQRARTEEEALLEADEVYDRLAQHAAAGRRLQPQDPRLSGLQGAMTLNAAFLVEDHHSVAFSDVVDELMATMPEGSLHVAGPWPPYSFATLETP